MSNIEYREEINMDVLKWKNEKTKGWIEKNIAYERWQVSKNGISVSHIYTDPIINIMEKQGFIEKSDFEIR